MKEHKRLFKKIWTAFTIVGRECQSHGGKIAIEWPQGCEYWRMKTVDKFLNDLQLRKVRIDGCALGLTDEKGIPIRKPWTIATNDTYLFRKFQNKVCPGTQQHPEHCPAAGKYTKMTENYTDKMVKIIHKAWKCSVLHRIKHELAAWETVPAMPVTQNFAQSHRPRIPQHERVFNAMVVRSVGRKEMLANPKALAAMDAEWNKLLNQTVWDMSTVREYDDVVAEAKTNRVKVHFGDIFGICGLKGSELPENDPGRKWKGRYVFRGNQVKDEFNNNAIFDELSSSPATLEASKAVDAYGMLEGHDSSQCDAEQAYVQSRLGGIPTWVRLPRDRWPAEWKGYRRPVVQLKLALYGHPDAGGYWEAHCRDKLEAGGFAPVPDWNSVYWHKELKLVLMVYVDDFKMSGPTENLAKGWQIIRSSIKTDDPQPPGKCLGCNHIIRSVTIGDKKLKQMVYDMEPFMVSCVDKYLEAAGKDKSSLKYAATPFLDDDRLPEVDEADRGALQPIASSILMKILYAARMARFDLLKAVSNLAKKVTKWNSNCDKQLHRMICYINSSLDLRLKGHIGDSSDQLELSLYSDADFAGDKESSRSTTGIFLALTGPNTFFPLNGVSKKQTCVSHSTPEAEIVAANAAVRLEGLPALQLWDTILDRKVHATLLEDNQATLQILKSGKNPALRHISRTHRVNMAWISDVFRKCDQMGIKYCSTSEQAADIMTKGFTNPVVWDRAISLIGLRPNHDKRHEYGIRVPPAPPKPPKPKP